MGNCKLYINGEKLSNECMFLRIFIKDGKMQTLVEAALKENIGLHWWECNGNELLCKTKRERKEKDFRMNLHWIEYKCE